MANPLPPFPLPLPPPGQGFQGPPMPQHHRDFASFYGDNSLDHCHSDYTRILECFDPEVTTVLMHVLMHEQAVSSGPIPQAYLYCASQRQQVQIFCVHLPTKFPSALDGQTTPWDGVSFAYLGEIIQGVVSTIEFPATCFFYVANICAKMKHTS